MTRFLFMIKKIFQLFMSLKVSDFSKEEKEELQKRVKQL